MGDLEIAVCSLLQSCAIDCCQIDGNVKMKDLGIKIDDPNQDIEFDILAVVENIGIIFETTTQSKGNKKKIDEFMHKADNFISAHKQNTLNLNVFNNSDHFQSKLTEIKEWRFVYIGTSEELETKNIIPSIFPNSNNIVILNAKVLEYLQYLEECLGTFAKNDVLSYLKIMPIDPEAPRKNLEITAIKLENKKISGSIDADVFLFQIPASNLLYLAHVPRYGYDDDVSQDTYINYQRLPKKKKLQDITELIKKGQGNYSFPNAVTVVLPDNIRISEENKSVKQLIIPCSRRSIKIIDGQHRIFAYARSELSDERLKKSKIMAVGLKFPKKSQQNKEEAKIFVEINREQTKVPKDLILLLGYPVLGETTPIALSAYVISKLNIEKGGALQNILATKPHFIKSSKSKPIEIVMISKELSKMFNDKKIKNDSPEKNIDYLYDITSKYFRILKSNFDDDWQNKSSLIFSSKYIAAFVRLLVEYNKKGYSQNTIGNKIQKLKKKLVDLLQSEDGMLEDKIVFSRNYKIIPPIKADHTTIVKFILKYGL